MPGTAQGQGRDKQRHSLFVPACPYLTLSVPHNFMAAADSAVVLLELDVQWD